MTKRLLIYFILLLTLGFSFLNVSANTENTTDTEKALHLKGQIHTHSTNSDGFLSPVEVGKAYKNVGFDFYTITDHNEITPDPNISDITWIGESMEASYYYHATVYDITDSWINKSASNDEETVFYSAFQEILDFYSSRNRLVSFSHPGWYYRPVSKEDILQYTGFQFIEVYNGVLKLNGEDYWDIELSAGNKIFGIAVDDAHRSYQINKGWVVVNVDNNEKNEILTALRNGDFYASNGNDIKTKLDGTTIYASSSSNSNFIFIGKDGKILKTVSDVSLAQYNIVGYEQYVRVDSINVETGAYAWSQPIYTDFVKNIFFPICENSKEE